jgi:hypothetical protein
MKLKLFKDLSLHFINFQGYRWDYILNLCLSFLPFSFFTIYQILGLLKLQIFNLEKNLTLNFIQLIFGGELIKRYQCIPKFLWSLWKFILHLRWFLVDFGDHEINRVNWLQLLIDIILQLININFLIINHLGQLS